MIRHWQSLTVWLDHRTGLPDAARRFLDEEIPASSGWRQVFGSVALFLLLVQAYTGVLLAFNYAPTPGDAYNSMRYILSELTAGRLIRGLHHWGASMMIVVVVLHMIQVFVFGAYKKPREATWIAGVALLLMTLAFGLTGYLLPWDNRAYWGTVVTTQIAGQAPVVGPYVTRLLGAGAGGVGVVTFARFFGLHVLVLPLTTVSLVTLHIYLVRKHGVAPLPGDEYLPRKRFFPQQVFKDTVAVFAAFVILFGLAALARVPLEKLADPSDITYTPRPEWYFLFLFQTLKLFNGPLEVVGTVVLPGLAVLALTLVPFIDRGNLVRVTKRTVAGAFVALALVAWTGLTVAAVASTPKEEATKIDYSGPTGWLQLSPQELSGIARFRQERCATCHASGGDSQGGPNLTETSVHRDAAWMLRHFQNPAAVRPGSPMPPTQLNDDQLSSLAAFLLKLNPRNASALESAPEFAAAGALVYQDRRCGECHSINGVGEEVGPALNGLATRRTRSWVLEHFADPGKLSPGTRMKPYQFPPRDLENLTEYLFALPEQQK